MADERAGRTNDRSRREFARLLVALAAGGLLAAFAVLNTDQVEVNWVFGTFETPLIIVILVCVAVGIVIGLLGGGARMRTKAKRAAAKL